MKKTIAIILSILLLLAFAGCNKNAKDHNISDGNINEATEEALTGIVFNEAAEDDPAVYAVVSNDSPAVGEEIVIDIRLKNAPLFCSIDLSLDYNVNALTIKHSGNCKIPNIVDNINIENGKVIYSGLVMRTENVADETLFKIKVTPKDGAIGTQSIKINGQSLLLALDSDGNATVDRSSDLVTTDILLNVQ